MIRVQLVVLLVIALASCSTTTQPDLVRLYGFQKSQHLNAVQPPVILVHGAFGARLMQPDGEEVWPGGLGRLLFDEYRDIQLEPDPITLLPRVDNLAVNGVTGSVAGQDYYQRILDVLQTVGRYERTLPGTEPNLDNRRFYVFEYDWRQDNVQTAKKLHEFLDQIRVDHSDSALKFDFVTHSMGGLVVRYFSRYGAKDVLDDNDFPVNNTGNDYIRRFVLLGTPSLGSAQAVQNLITGMKVGFKSMPTEVLASFPSAYQLLPHPLNSWLITADGQPLERDLFDVEIWRRFGFSIFSQGYRDRHFATGGDEQSLEAFYAYFEKHIERGRRFVWSLTVPAPKLNVRPVVFGGDCHLTPARLLVEEVDGASKVRMYPNEILNPVAGVNYEQIMLEPGDGTVTKASLLARPDLDPTIARHKYSYFSMKYSMFLCEKHGQLTGNINFQDNLMHVLLSADEAG